MSALSWDDVIGAIPAWRLKGAVTAALLPLVFVCVCAFATPAVAGVREGEAAYRRQDYATAFREFSAAAEHGDPLAAVYLGSLYESGLGVARDYTAALRWNIAGAEADPKVANIVGKFYQIGRGTKPDDKEALKWFRKAAARGVPDAMNNIGGFHSGGRGGLAQDDREAFAWYSKAAQLGDATAESNLALAYAGAYGVSQDFIAARQWAEKSAAQGNPFGLSVLASMYFRGDGGEKDLSKAIAAWGLKPATT
jgi:TPR repeat protein